MLGSWINQKLLGLGFFLLAWCSPSVWLQAQDKTPVYLPQDSIVVFALDVAAIQNNKDLEVLPWEVASAAGKEYLGVDPLLATEVWGGVGLPSVSGPEFGLHFSTSQPINIEDFKPELFGPIKTSAKAPDLKLRPMNDTPFSIVQNKNSLMFGTEGTLRKLMAARGTPSKLIPMLATDQDPVRIAIAIEPLRDLINTSIEQYRFLLSEDMASDITELVNKVEYVYIRSSVGYDISTKIHFGGADDSAAQRIHELLISLRAQGFEQLLAQVEAQMVNTPMSDALRTAWSEYLVRARGILEASMEPVLADQRATIEFKNMQSYYLTSMAFGLLMPAIDAARMATQNTTTSNNLKQLGLAFHNHSDVFRKFPARTITNVDGEPLLSWRVTLLPFLEEGELHNQFHFDEPWDSEHNQKLLAKIPAVYQNPRVNVPEGYTTYVAPFGGEGEKRTLWDIEDCGFRNITDGTSNTILFVEVNEEAAVPWTKPDDFDVAAQSLLKFLLPSPKGGGLGLCDGSVFGFDENMDEETLEALLSAGGGEVVEFR